MSGGVDASRATFMKQIFYAYDGNAKGFGIAGGVVPMTAGDHGGVTVAAGDITPDGGVKVGGASNLTAADCNTAAIAVCVNGGVVRSSSGLLYGGSASWSVANSSFPELSEEGGAVNVINSRSIQITATIKKYGMAMTYTVDEVKMGSIKGLIAQKIKDLGQARGEVREMQVQYDLLAASEANVLYASTTATTTSLGSVGPKDIVDYEVLRQMAGILKKARVPFDTKVITGSTKIGTKVVGKAYYCYVPYEAFNTLEDITDSSSNRKWEPVESYMDGAGGNVAAGEIGRIGQIRFIEVEDMLRYDGKGAAADDDNEDGTGEDAVTVYSTNGKVDVFPKLFVGSDSFTTIGFDGTSSQVKHNVPKGDSHNDFFGEKGSLAVKWWHGTLVKRPERI